MPGRLATLTRRQRLGLSSHRRKITAASEDRTHDLRIMRPTRCQLRYSRLRNVACMRHPARIRMLRQSKSPSGSRTCLSSCICACRTQSRSVDGALGFNSYTFDRHTFQYPFNSPRQAALGINVGIRLRVLGYVAGRGRLTVSCEWLAPCEWLYQRYRHRGDSNACGQILTDFESISLTARTQHRAPKQERWLKRLFEVVMRTHPADLVIL